MIVYMTVNKLNGKAYIGKYSGSRKNYIGSGIALRKAIKKYGEKNFYRIILENCNTLQELAEREKYWITKMNAVNSDNFYNMKEGGTGGWDHITENDYSKRSENRFGKKIVPPENAILGKYIQEYKVNVDGKVHIISGIDNVAKFLGMERTQVYTYLNHKGPLQGYKYNSLEVCYHTKITYLIEGIYFDSIKEIKKKYPQVKPATISYRLINSDRWDWWKIKTIIE